MLIKTSDLTERALDWAVASIEKLPKDILVVENGTPVIHRKYWDEITLLRCEFSSHWAQGGPIIEREEISIEFCRAEFKSLWIAYKLGLPHEDSPEGGPTPLIAAMRCFVASRLGDEVEVPDGLH